MEGIEFRGVPHGTGGSWARIALRTDAEVQADETAALVRAEESAALERLADDGFLVQGGYPGGQAPEVPAAGASPAELACLLPFFAACVGSSLHAPETLEAALISFRKYSQRCTTTVAMLSR